ncbi:MAG: hypothetical protein IT444_07275 [Phycisphaeraceae bacterium]|nr:hypothetical protein [Phycisphaeraceae bacterium]
MIKRTCLALAILGLSLGITVPSRAADGPAADAASVKENALPAISSVRFDDRGDFLVNDKPFFPILLYDAPTDAATLKQLHEFGFNVLTVAPAEADALREQGFYTAAHVSGKMDKLGGVFLAISADSPALYFKDNLVKQTQEANDKVRAAIPGRPVMNAIGYWENEPEGVIAGKLPSKATYDDLVAAIEVSAPYLYPVPYQPVSTVGDAVARARIATDGKKPLIPILQVFSWDLKDRYPTPAELRVMVYLSLVEGADGIGYYSYGSVTGHPKKTIAQVQPELWQSVKALNHEAAKTGPRLQKGEDVTATVLKDLPKGLYGKAVREGDQLLIIVVNPAAQKATLSVAAPAQEKTIDPMSVMILELPAAKNHAE